ncbi:winged helix DNA-binding domain-containing protein [Angustibacter luteus]|uniref:Winged helix DNA-binding domain-containing protein n=1 Tax=Angustibacter luteus TaxID=658456 RepID=A0ABW1JFB8_9ACTN
MDALQIAHRRLRAQHLTGPPAPDVAAVVRDLGAVQAQEFAPALWSVAQRTAGYDQDAVMRAYDAGVLLRSHALRPTWHFLLPEDIGWVQRLTAPRVHGVSRYYYRQVGIDDAVAGRAGEVMLQALDGGAFLTRAELSQALARSGIQASGVRLAYLVMHAELEGLIASGAMRGKQHTYAALSERAPASVRWEPDDPLRELTRRYLSGHGPATVKDLSWWASLTLTQVRDGIARLGDEVASIDVDGLTYWFVGPTTDEREASPSVRLLQAYDEFGVAFTEGRAVTNVAGHKLVPPSANTVVHLLVLDSQVVGLWRRVVRKGGLDAELTTAVRLGTRQRKAVETAFAEYAQFTGQPVDVHWTEP